jgi:hypothetical protein
LKLIDFTIMEDINIGESYDWLVNQISINMVVSSRSPKIWGKPVSSIGLLLFPPVVVVAALIPLFV